MKTLGPGIETIFALTFFLCSWTINTHVFYIKVVPQSRLLQTNGMKIPETSKIYFLEDMTFWSSCHATLKTNQMTHYVELL